MFSLIKYDVLTIFRQIKFILIGLLSLSVFFLFTLVVSMSTDEGVDLNPKVVSAETENSISVSNYISIIPTRINDCTDSIESDLINRFNFIALVEDSYSKPTLEFNCTHDQSKIVIAYQNESHLQSLVDNNVLSVPNLNKDLPFLVEKKNIASDERSYLSMYIWSLLVAFLFVPARLASYLVFQEKVSGRLEELFGIGISFDKYIWAKSITLVLIVLFIITFLLFFFTLMGTTLLHEGFANKPGLMANFFAVSNLATDIPTSELIIEVMKFFVFGLLANIVIPILVPYILLTIAFSVFCISYYVKSKSQIKSSFLMEVSVLFVGVFPLMLASLFPGAYLMEYIPIASIHNNIVSSFQSGLSASHIAPILTHLILVSIVCIYMKRVRKEILY